MYITFMIGNGFDLSLGLKTQYTDFFKYYIDQNSTNHVVNELKGNIERNLSTWADAELALGQYTKYFGIDEIAQFDSCYNDFCLSLIKYLKSQENSIANIVNHTNMSDQIKEGMFKLVIQLPSLLRNQSTEVISKLIDSSPQNHEYKFLNFNYTNCFDKCLASIGAQGQSVSGHIVNKATYNNYLGNIIHIHGTLTEDMILGVNDESQIANKDLLKIRSVKRSIIKPIANEALRLERDTQGAEIINKSGIICIYGMSLGKTDAIWWERIGKWLQSNNSNQLIIMDYCKNYQPGLSTSFIREEENVQNLFLSYTGFENGVKENLMKRIHVAVNKPLFTKLTQVA